MSRKKAILSEPSSARPRNTANNNARLRGPTKERLGNSVLEELWSIWQADPRVPSVNSRRSWAISRSANPRLVDNWFLRRRACAKKSGQPVPDGSYDLSLDPTTAPRRERSETAIELELEIVPDLPSDDTLVYPPDYDDSNDLEASSDTVFDEDTFIESKRSKTPAYKVAPSEQPRSESYRFQPKSSFVDIHATKGKGQRDEDTSFEHSSFLLCNQGQEKQSDFLCVLCSTKSTQGTPDDVSPFPCMRFDSDSAGCLTISCPRLDFFPNTSFELSAIPFLFRTPPAVLRDDVVSHRTTDNWAVVEDELERLVNDRKLDFSFLDAPHLASMELRD